MFLVIEENTVKCLNNQFVIVSFRGMTMYFNQNDIHIFQV